MNENILLSVVTPCYNGFRFLNETFGKMEGVVPQWVEFVVVDDCSTDGSFDNLVRYADKSSLNIVVRKNEINCGPGCSRNEGIKIASGNYITFLDSDDYFSQDFFLEAEKYIKYSDCDCIVFDFITVYGNGKEVDNSIFYKEICNDEPSVSESLIYVRGATWGKIYKKDILANGDIKFLDLKRNEDMPFTKMAIAHCKKIGYIRKPLYCYVQNSASLMHNKKLLNADNARQAFEYLDEKLSSNFRREMNLIFLLEYFYSTGVTNSYKMKRKEWKAYVDSMMPRFRESSPLLDESGFSKVTKCVINHIAKKRYFFVRNFFILKNIIKK